MKKFLHVIRAIFFLLLFGNLAFFAYLWFKPEKEFETTAEPKQIVQNEEPVIVSVQETATREKIIVTNDIENNVPFTSQAPSGKWANQLFQDGCEEASVAMAMAWVKGQAFSPGSAEKEILDISAWEKKIFGFAVDSSVDDTARIFREYYGHENLEVLKNIDVDDIKSELAKGRILVVPADGRILANPHYTPPGPEEHMLVVTGYDAKNDSFITNDPGTKFGEKYSYETTHFIESVWSYPTGAKHTPYPGSQNAKKDMISVWK